MKADQREALVQTLRQRFTQNMHRPAGVDWADVQARLQASPAKLKSLAEMEGTGGEPSNWVATQADIRKLGGALFCDRRYGQVFVYHNGAQSYYAARGFRGWVSV